MGYHSLTTGPHDAQRHDDFVGIDLGGTTVTYTLLRRTVAGPAAMPTASPLARSARLLSPRMAAVTPSVREDWSEASGRTSALIAVVMGAHVVANHAATAAAPAASAAAALASGIVPNVRAAPPTSAPGLGSPLPHLHRTALAAAHIWAL